jgi:hypothetical protein
MGQKVNVAAKLDNDVLSFPLHVNNKTYVLSTPIRTVCAGNGCRVCLPTESGILNMTIRQIQRQKDDLNDYVYNFMQWYFVILNFKDTIKEGDIYRTNVILKMMVPFLYSHSVLSKYFVECIDYILKTEVMLSPRLSMRVRMSSFVNPKGGKGKNKAADMQNPCQNATMVDHGYHRSPLITMVQPWLDMCSSMVNHGFSTL